MTVLTLITVLVDDCVGTTVLVLIMTAGVDYSVDNCACWWLCRVVVVIVLMLVLC